MEKLAATRMKQAPGSTSARDHKRSYPTPQKHLRQHYRVICNAEQNDGDTGSLNEDLIARLRAAEEEANMLKTKLDQVKQQLREEDTRNGDGTGEETNVAGKRIDGADLRRETLSFVENKPRNWLSESDIEFFTGGGPSEAVEGMDSSRSQEKDIVQRRLLIGLGLSAALGAFALVPTEKLQPPPSKPLFFYLVPLLRVQDILVEIIKVIPDGNYEQLRRLLSRIVGPPNSVQENLKAAAASLPDAKLVEKADVVARDVFEYLKGIDYQTYYESVGGVSTGISGGGQQLKEMFEYSSNSAEAAQHKLEEFLNLMPEDQVLAARQQMQGSSY